jgi:hypothetical protein
MQLRAANLMCVDCNYGSEGGTDLLVVAPGRWLGTGNDAGDVGILTAAVA